MRDFIESNFRHFNSGALADCASSLRSFLEQDGRLMVTLAGAMSTAEIGRTLAPAIKAQRVHAICCTGANLEEDLFGLLARSSFEGIADWRELTAQDETGLFERGMNRVTDVAIPEEEAITLFFDLSIQFKKTNDFVFFSTKTFPIISSFNLVGEMNLISKDIVTHGFPFAK